MRGFLTRIGALLAVLCLAAPAQAGVFIHDHIIGFSPDGRYFAFEEYGIQDGSGLPHASLYVIDLETDSWVPGSPFSERMGEEDIFALEAAPDAVYPALARVRETVRDAAAPLLERLNVVRPATELFASGIGDAHVQPDRITVYRPNPSFPTQEDQGSMDLLLERIPAASPIEYCPRPEALAGFRLTRIGPDGAGELVHEDTAIPRSRGCAEDYRVARVLSAGYPQPDGLGVALIAVFTGGFEGVDRRFIAVPVRLP